MSHVVKMDAVYSDLDALEATAKERGGTFVRNKKNFEWYGRWVNDYHSEDAAYRKGIKPEDYGKCDHAIKIPGTRYEVGVVRMPNGTYGLVYDFYCCKKQMEAVLGVGGKAFAQCYAKNKTLAELKRQGKHGVQQRKLANGTIQITVNA